MPMAGLSIISLKMLSERTPCCDSTKDFGCLRPLDLNQKGPSAELLVEVLLKRAFICYENFLYDTKKIQYQAKFVKNPYSFKLDGLVKSRHSGENRSPETL